MVAVGVGTHDLRPILLRLADPFAVAGERHPGALPGGEQRFQGEPGVRHHWQRTLLECVERAHVDGDEAHVRVVEQALRRGGEVAHAGADRDHQVRLLGDARRRAGALHAVTAERPLRRTAQRALAGVGLAHRDAEPGGHGAQRVPRRRVVHAAAGDDQRPLCRLQQRHRLRDPFRGRRTAFDAPSALGEEVRRVVPGVRLHVLRQRQGHRAGLGRVGEHPHRLRQRGEKLFGAVDAVEEPAHRAKAVVHAHVRRGGVLQLLQHRPLVAGRVVVGGEQQHRHAVDGGGGRAGHHVGGAGPDRAGARQGLGAPHGAGEPGRGMHHRLLVAGLVVGQRSPTLLQGLPQAAHVAVAEDAEDGGYQPPPRTVQLAVLNRQVLHQCLPHGHALSCLTSGQPLRLPHAPPPPNRGYSTAPPRAASNHQPFPAGSQMLAEPTATRKRAPRTAHPAFPGPATPDPTVQRRRLYRRPGGVDPERRLGDKGTRQRRPILLRTTAQAPTTGQMLFHRRIRGRR